MLSSCDAEEDAWESLGQQGDQTSQFKRKSPWILIGRTDAEAETTILWSPDVKSQLIGKDPDAGKDWGQEEKGQQRMRWFIGITDSMDMSLSKLRETVKTGEPGMLPSMESQRVRHNWATQQKQHVPNFANLSSWFLPSWRPSSLCLLNLIHSGFWKFFLLWQVCVFQIYALHYCIDPGPVTAYFSYSSFYNSCYVPTH